MPIQLYEAWTYIKAREFRVEQARRYPESGCQEILQAGLIQDKIYLVLIRVS
jgi:hypothetical protein